MTASFGPFQDEFLAFTAEIVWCTMATVDAQGRPRQRIMHPIWQVLDDRPVGWLLTSRTPVKTRHLATNPHVSCAYWSPAQNTVVADCVASWVEEPAAKHQVWDLFATTPPPLGYDPGGGGILAGPDDPRFTPLRLAPWRVQILHFEGWTGNLTPRMWLAEGHGARDSLDR